MSDLPRGWEWSTLGEIGQIQGGIQKQAKRRPVKNRFPFLRVANVPRGELDLSEVHEIELFDGEIERYRLQFGDLLIVEGNGSLSQLGRAAMWRNQIRDCVHQNHLIRVRPDRGVEPEYLVHVWNSEIVTTQLERLGSSTSGLHTLNFSKIRPIRIPVPPVAEQRLIAVALEDHLSRFDAGLAYVRIAQRRLDVLVKRVIVEAVPVPGKGHWRCVTVGEAGHVDLGRQRHPDWHTGPNMRPYLRVANIFEDRIDLKDVKSMDFPPDVFNRFKLHPGDILLNEGQSPEYLGRPAMYRGKPNEFAFTNSLLRFRTQPDVLPEWALLVFRRHMHARRFIREVRITTNIAHLSASRFKSVEFPTPPLDEQKLIIAQTEESLGDIARMSRALDTAHRRADKLRRCLLANAFAGRLVPQDPDDEPASVLLERIRAERATRPKSKRTRRTKQPDAAQEALL